MTKKLLDEIVEISFKENALDEKMIMDIASKLKRRELKAYVRRLRNELSKRSVMIISPRSFSENAKNLFHQTFSDKIVTFETDPSYLLGVKIINGDMVYDQTLKGEFDHITQRMRE